MNHSSLAQISTLQALEASLEPLEGMDKFKLINDHSEALPQLLSDAASAFLEGRGLSSQHQQQLGIRWASHKELCEEWGYSGQLTSQAGGILFPFPETPETKGMRLSCIRNFYWAGLTSEAHQKLLGGLKFPKYLTPKGQINRIFPFYAPYGYLEPESVGEAPLFVTEDVVGVARAAIAGFNVWSSFGTWLATKGGLKAWEEGNLDEEAFRSLIGAYRPQIKLFLVDNDSYHKKQVYRSQIRNAGVLGCKVGAWPASGDGSKVGLDEVISQGLDFVAIAQQEAKSLDEWLSFGLEEAYEQLGIVHADNPAKARLDFIKFQVPEIVKACGEGAYEQYKAQLKQFGLGKMEWHKLCKAHAKKEKASSATSYEIRDGMLGFISEVNNEKHFNPICGEIELEGWIEDSEGSNCQLAVRLLNVRGQERRFSIPKGLVFDGRALINKLQSYGHHIILHEPSEEDRSGSLNVQRVAWYLNEEASKLRDIIRVHHQPGWFEGSFLTDAYVVGDDCLRLRQYEAHSNPSYGIKGSLEEWNEEIGQYLKGNEMLIFAVGCVLGGALLEPLGVEGGGFHLWHPSGAGKTTTMMVAASVAGSPGFMRSWKSTGNAIEALAIDRNDSCLLLDEINQAAEDGSVGDAVYQLSNGQSKNRMTKAMNSQDSKSWRCLFLSNGERPLSAYMKLSRKQQTGGQAVRMPSIASPSESGLFQERHHFKDWASFGEHLKAASKRVYGSPLKEFLMRLQGGLEEGSDEAQGLFDAFYKQMAIEAGEGATEQRLARRFTLVCAALELGCRWGILPLHGADCYGAVMNAFRSVLSAEENTCGELYGQLQEIRYLLLNNMNSRRSIRIESGSNGTSIYYEDNEKIVDRMLGWVLLEKAAVVGDDGETTGFAINPTEFWVSSVVFDNELIGNKNPKELRAELIKRGWIIPSGEPETATCRKRLPGHGRVSFYRFDLVKMGEE